MGNSGSQTEQTNQRTLTEDQWANSFPKTYVPRLNYQHKVLPERDVQQKLRPTNNGDILHSGGTLSGRQNRPPPRRNNQYSPHGPKQPSSPLRMYFSSERDPLHKSRSQAAHRHNQNVTSHKPFKEQMKSFASEPDLRSSVSHEMKERKSKKKYKAPPPPQNSKTNEKLEWEENSSDTDFPVRKARLFKTRAETKKNSSHVNKFPDSDYSKNQISNSNSEPCSNLRSHRLSLPELKTATCDEFQKELKEATKRLRHIHAETSTTIKYETNENKTHIVNNEKLKTLDHNVNNAENIRRKLKEMETDDNKNIINLIRGEASGKESSTPDTSPNLITKDITGRDQPKTFYFGMDEPTGNTDIVDAFTTNLHQINKISNSSESDLSSDIDSDENNVSKIGIDLQLRPILPKKQLEVPRFSPAVAWRLLSSMEINDTVTTTASDEVAVFVEERIEKYSRPPPPSVQVGQRSSNDKSGDSGISGDDAMPAACYDESPENCVVLPRPTAPYLTKQERISWTPQQDLGDDSSMEECTANNKSVVNNSKLTHSGPHLFSLSLPRDNQLAAYMSDKSNLHYSGLERLKKSVSGVLNNLSNKKDFTQANLGAEESENWFLSKSAPNSLSNGFHSLEVRKSQDSEQIYPSGISKSSRVMYLPETETDQNGNISSLDENKKRILSTDQRKFKLSVYSKSCEDLTTEVINCPEILADSPRLEEYKWDLHKKPKKFTFQSTIRQIEKKRLSDKLSREAERREKKRLRELEAMQKVEEEFQKKRAREKANIRQQLRLYCMDEVPAWSSLPPNLEVRDEVRPDPDGAVSSSTTSSSPLPPVKTLDKKYFQKSFDKKDINNKIRPPATRELSEYRQTSREYKEYRGSMKYISDAKYSKQTTVHPQVTCNMPKAKGTKTAACNYRKNFSSGVKSTASAGSTYSEDSQNNSQIYRSRYGPITR
ncbi:hypothetical protein NQ315_015113 [Exocentrus adspersus]|uniref:Uncharacterized protein n=1 Tax=Exocentrus adspersus TaxID=1586481 RepID=A0AAV8VAB1_9CUCU|nr:hypothetical protein NQ315_015113 [Exocentrus adspersus]